MSPRLGWMGVVAALGCGGTVTGAPTDAGPTDLEPGTDCVKCAPHKVASLTDVTAMIAAGEVVYAFGASRLSVFGPGSAESWSLEIEGTVRQASLGWGRLAWATPDTGRVYALTLATRTVVSFPVDRIAAVAVHPAGYVTASAGTGTLVLRDTGGGERATLGPYFAYTRPLSLFYADPYVVWLDQMDFVLIWDKVRGFEPLGFARRPVGLSVGKALAVWTGEDGVVTASTLVPAADGRVSQPWASVGKVRATGLVGDDSEAYLFAEQGGVSTMFRVTGDRATRLLHPSPPASLQALGSDSVFWFDGSAILALPRNCTCR